MIPANIPQNEAERLENLNSYNILDTLPEKEFDAITKIASGICNTSISLVSIIDRDRQWFKSNHGLDSKQTSRDISFCAHGILKPDELFIVNDASKDERFRNNPLTIDTPNIIFYAGAPLNSSEGYPLGTLCVIDNEPKELSEDQKESLKLLAKQVVTLLELRKKNKELAESNKKNLKLNEQLNDFAFRLTHDLKSPINGVRFLLDVLKEDYLKLYQNTKVEDYVNLISNRINYMDNLVNEILNYTKVTSENLIYNDFNLKNLLDSIIANIDFENKILLNSENLNLEISSSKIGILQVFQNLISNSIKFCDKEKVVIDVIFKEEEEEEEYHFTYMDNGPGIEKEYRDKVFQMFETLENTDNNNTGIGLTTVKSIINRLGGKIYLDDREDNKKGVCFHFYISKTNNN
jgi:signal transduction histidine kinase